MTEKDRKFVVSWSSKLEAGPVKFFLKNTLLACLLSTVVFLFYTWENIPENKFLVAIGPILLLSVALGLPLGLIISWQTWVRGNNRYTFLTKDGEFPNQGGKKKWLGHDKVWDVGTSLIGVVFFILLYISIFLFDTGKPTTLKLSIVGILLSYFAAQVGYTIYRYVVDKRGETKTFPRIFKFIFCAIIVITIILWLVLFYVMD